MIKEFKEFAIKGNVVDMAVGIIIGGAFTTVVKTLVDGVIMPPIGLLTGRVDFSNKFFLLRTGKTPGPYDTVEHARDAGAVVLSYGQLINAVVSFLMVALVLFYLVRWINRLRRPDHPDQASPTTKPCPYCRSVIDVLATRCPKCTSHLEKDPKSSGETRGTGPLGAPGS